MRLHLRKYCADGSGLHGWKASHQQERQDQSHSHLCTERLDSYSLADLRIAMRGPAGYTTLPEPSGRDGVSRRRFLTAASTGVAGATVVANAFADTLADVPPRGPGRL
jgi:hypothetical protein